MYQRWQGGGVLQPGNKILKDSSGNTQLYETIEPRIQLHKLVYFPFCYSECLRFWKVKLKSKFEKCAVGGECAAVRASVREINNKPFLVIGTIITLRNPQSVLAVTQGPRWRDRLERRMCSVLDRCEAVLSLNHQLSNILWYAFGLWQCVL